MGRVMLSGVAPHMTIPKTEIVLFDLAEGSIVKLNENGSPVEFYVAKHDYEPTLNGTGRTLLVRKDCYDQRAWNSSLLNVYSASDINSFLNGDYKSLLDNNVQTAIGQTKFYYTYGNNTNSNEVTNLQRSVFLLSLTEYGYVDDRANTEGSPLPIASILQTAYLNGLEIAHWTRSPSIEDVRYSMGVKDGYPASSYCTNDYGSRPCFTLPSNAVFDKNTLLLKGVS